MIIIFYADLIVFLIVYIICITIGLDLKKWQSWLAGLYGFISGWSLGLLLEAGSSSWKMGMLCAVVIMSSGAVLRQQRIYFRKVCEDFLTVYGQDKRYALLARLVKKALRK